MQYLFLAGVKVDLTLFLMPVPWGAEIVVALKNMHASHRFMSAVYAFPISLAAEQLFHLGVMAPKLGVCSLC